VSTILTILVGVHYSLHYSPYYSPLFTLQAFINLAYSPVLHSSATVFKRRTGNGERETEYGRIFRFAALKTMTNIALTIAGSDPSGGAGIQADLKTFHQREVYGASVITLLTVQNTQRVSAVEILSARLVIDQLEAVLEDIPPGAAKTGALGNREIVEALAVKARGFEFPLVVDPVMISKQGQPLMTEPAREALAKLLLPHAFLTTPNLQEAGELAHMPVHDLQSMKDAAVRIADLGAKAVLLKGGHLLSDAVDVLYWEGKFTLYQSGRIDTPHTHGTGCTLSACITAELAKGHNLPEAVETAKRFVTRAIETNPGLGKGSGPVNHHARI
jgi:hydroxymethylpyrimidine/phosphomethylpyrimidine kinase